MTLGFIGTGNIASAVVMGRCASQAPPGITVVSPRGAARAGYSPGAAATTKEP